MTASLLLSPAEEVRRLRNQLAELQRLVAALVAADVDPKVTVALARRWAADAARVEYERGWDAGRLDLRADDKRAGVGIVAALRDAAPPASRWHVCCVPCRRAGHKPGCRDCEDRTRQTFAQPAAAEYQGGPVASW